MDAKPVRGFRIQDENAMPMAQQKTIHTRNKSSPALSTLAKNGAVKMAVKRSAFGDISQTTKGNRPLGEVVQGGKDGKIQQQEKKYVPALSQPAQRPFSVANGQTLGNGRGLAELDHNTQVKKVISKRATTIFKDYSTLPHNTTSNAVQTRSLLTGIQQYEPPAPIKVENKPPPRTETIDSYPSSNLLSGIQDLHIPAPQVNDVAPPVRQSEIIIQEKVNTAVQQAPRPIHPEPKQPPMFIHEDSIKEYPSIHAPAVTTYSTPQEYIEDEYEEEECYVTAKSIRSRQENTTENNLTDHLAPKSTQDIEVELAAAAAVVAMLREPADIEDEDWDISMVSEYKAEIFEYYRELEIRYSPNPHYMSNQTEIQWSMRSVLIDWVVQVHDRFGLLPETLFLTVNIIDRFLSIKVVSMNKLQLVGATALFVAAKYEEVTCPTLKEMVFMVDNGYDEDEILKAERFMLTLLDFDLGWPGPMNFLRRISAADDYDLETRTVGKYFIEITLMDEQFLSCPPSFIAAGAHCLARLMLNKGHWSTAHVHYSGYTYPQLLPLLRSMVECLENPTCHHNAIYEKYSTKKFKASAQFARTEMRRGFRLIDTQTNLAHNFDQLCRTEAIFEYIYRDVPGYGGHAVRSSRQYALPPISPIL